VEAVRARLEEAGAPITPADRGFRTADPWDIGLGILAA
jgi:hypothetical protein